MLKKATAFFSKVFRQKWYESIGELQRDLDIFIRKYNEERSHRGYRTKDRTPLQTLRDWIKKPNREKGGERALKKSDYREELSKYFHLSTPESTFLTCTNLYFRIQTL